jgi:hypothetical protein
VEARVCVCRCIFHARAALFGASRCAGRLGARGFIRVTTAVAQAMAGDRRVRVVPAAWGGKQRYAF